MIKVFHKIIDTCLISIMMIGIVFSLSSCSEDEVNILDLALDSLKLDLNNVNKPLYLAKQIFLNHEDIDYCFNIDWSYTNQEHWNNLYDLDNCYVLEAKDYFDKFDFDIIATIANEKEFKSKVFHGNYINKDKPLNSIDLLPTLENGEEIDLEGMAINIYENNSFVFYDGEKSIIVEIDDSEQLVYNIKIVVTLKVDRTTININDENIDKITVKYVSHRNIAGTFGEKLDYKSTSYNLEDLYEMSRNINLDNYRTIDQRIVRTSGVIKLQDDDYYICLDDMSLNISYKDNPFYMMEMIDCIDCYCTVDLFVNSIIEDSVIKDYSFSIINIFINNK